MGLSFGPTSDTRSTSDSSSITLTAGDASALSVTRGQGKSTVVGAGGSLIKVNRGAHVTFTSTDHGALEAAQAAIDKIVKSQADTTAAALGSVGHIAETRLTDGGNVVAGSVQKIAIGLAVVAGVVALVFFFKRRG